MKGGLDESLELSTKAADLARSLGFPEIVLAALGVQAKVYRNRGDLERAYANLVEAERLGRSTLRNDDLATVLDNLGLVENDRGNHSEALKHFEEEARLLRALGQRHALVQAIERQGIILATLGEARQALERNRQAEVFWREIGTQASWLGTWRCRGRCWPRTGLTSRKGSSFSAKHGR